jgi:PST family polysaccharide transporter
MFPIWYFQGIEKMKYITYITLVSRLFFVGMIFILIKSSSDYLLLPIINGFGALIAGSISLIIIFGKHDVDFKYQSIDRIKHYLKDSIPIFISNVSVRLYVSTNKVIIGSFLGMADLAYYDLGEKITSILKTPQTILSQTLFPKINKDKNISFVKKAFKISVTINFLLVIFTIVFSKNIVLLLAGKEMLPAIWIINILALSVPIIAMSNIFGVQLLIPFGKIKLFSKIVISSGVIYLFQLILIWLVWSINIYSLAVITVTTEIVVTAIMFHFCKKNKLW